MSIAARRVASVSTLASIREPQRFVLDWVDWNGYLAIADHAIGERHVRVTYDRGRIELMSLSLEHERYKGTLSILFRVLCRRYRRLVNSYGSMTCRKESLQRAFEPDECFYTVSRKRMLRVLRRGFEAHPPPDVVLEVNIPRSSIDRPGICAAMGVPELWHFDGKKLRAFKLAQGTYEDIQQSPMFPGVVIKELVPFLHDGFETDDGALERGFAMWLSKKTKALNGKRNP